MDPMPASPRRDRRRECARAMPVHALKLNNCHRIDVLTARRRKKPLHGQPIVGLG